MERQGGRWECSCHGSTCPHPGALQAPSIIVDCNVTTLSNLFLTKMTKRRIELAVFVLRYFGEQQIPIRYTRDICFVPTSEPTHFAVWIQRIEIVCTGVWCAAAVVYAVASRFGFVSAKAKCLKSIARQSVTEKDKQISSRSVTVCGLLDCGFVSRTSKVSKGAFLDDLQPWRHTHLQGQEAAVPSSLAYRLALTTDKHRDFKTVWQTGSKSQLFASHGKIVGRISPANWFQAFQSKVIPEQTFPPHYEHDAVSCLVCETAVSQEY